MSEPLRDPAPFYIEMLNRLRRTLANLDALSVDQEHGTLSPDEADTCLQALRHDLAPVMAHLDAWHRDAHPAPTSGCGCTLRTRCAEAWGIHRTHASVVREAVANARRWIDALHQHLNRAGISYHHSGHAFMPLWTDRDFPAPEELHP